MIYEVNNTSDLEKLSHGSFVRFESRLERNPLISLLESFEQMMVVAMAFQSSQKGGKKNSEQEILKQIKSMKNSLTENNNFLFHSVSNVPI